MQKSAHREVERIAAFLGIETDAALVHRVVELSGLEEMKRQASEQGGDKLGHLRKGGAGGWTEYFSKEMEEEFASKYDAVLGETGLRFSVGGSPERFL
jgi:hypothetical protein